MNKVTSLTSSVFLVIFFVISIQTKAQFLSFNDLTELQKCENIKCFSGYLSKRKFILNDSLKMSTKSFNYFFTGTERFDTNSEKVFNSNHIFINVTSSDLPEDPLFYNSFLTYSSENSPQIKNLIIEIEKKGFKASQTKITHGPDPIIELSKTAFSGSSSKDRCILEIRTARRNDGSISLSYGFTFPIYSFKGQ